MAHSESDPAAPGKCEPLFSPVWDERGRGLNPEKDSLEKDFLTDILAVEQFCRVGCQCVEAVREEGPLVIPCRLSRFFMNQATVLGIPSCNR